jgi:hypothetical protein
VVIGGAAATVIGNPLVAKATRTAELYQNCRPAFNRRRGRETRASSAAPGASPDGQEKGPARNHPRRASAVPEVVMPDPRSSRARWSLALAAGPGVLFAAVLFAEPPEDGVPPLLLSAGRVAAVLADDWLTVVVNLPPACDPPLEGTLSVVLVDSRGKILDGERKAVRLARAAGPAFVFKDPGLPAEQVRLRCRLAGEVLTVPLSGVLLSKGHETALSVGRDLFAGSRAAFRCEVRGVRSPRETVPLAGATVSARLRDGEGKSFALLEGRTGVDGVVEDQLAVPDLPPGQCTLEVVTRSPLGEDRLTRPVTIRAPARVLLVTDRPLYQPGQRMHLRALALRPHDLRPIAGGSLAFTVEDGRGNKVFQRSVKTSEHGVASAEFDLADEVNAGDYRLRASLGDHAAEKVVAVKPYVLPKFKVELTADRAYYLPGEVVHAGVRAGYFFGKPLSGAQVRVRAALGGVTLQTWEGTADQQGYARLKVPLPATLSDKDEASLRLTAEVTDTAAHTETAARELPVAAASLQVSLVPEGGHLVPGVENRVHVVAVRPDGSPAQCVVRVRCPQAKDKQVAAVETDTAGLASFLVTPDAAMVRQEEGGALHTIETLNGQVEKARARLLVTLRAETRDDKGDRAVKDMPLACEPLGENVRLRLDKAIYQAYERPEVEVFSTAGLGLAGLDLVKDGQVLWHRRLELEDGKARYRLDLPADTVGTLEVHAWQLLRSGEVIRDARLIYVEPPADLRVKVRPDKTEYRPGEEGRVRFEVTGAGGQPAVAALGVLVVDEAVYALQDVQPGLEKAFYTLRQELLRPQAERAFRRADLADDLVRGSAAKKRQALAAALFAGVRPPAPARHEIDPAFDRRVRHEARLAVLGAALYAHAEEGGEILRPDGRTGRMRFRPGLLQDMVRQQEVDPRLLQLPQGERLTLEELWRLEPGFTADRLAVALTRVRLSEVASALVQYSDKHESQWRLGRPADNSDQRRWVFPPKVLAEAVEDQNQPPEMLEDAWGRPVRLVRRPGPSRNRTGVSQLDHHELISAGPDGEFGTPDDVRLLRADEGWNAFWWWSDAAQEAWHDRAGVVRRWNWGPLLLNPLDDNAPAGFSGRGAGLAGVGGFGLAGLGGGVGVAGIGGGFAGAGFGGLGMAGGFQGNFRGAMAPPATPPAAGPTVVRMAAPARLREYFPETMLWRPELITDEHGVAELPVRFADSVTTWRLTASASSRDGLLGGATAPLRVFQDFFVDIDLPAVLTRGDEVAFPVAVYNYLKEPQTVHIELEPGDWFALTDDQGPRRTLELKAGEVTAVRFRVRANRVGHFPLTVRARGTKMSDAVRRWAEVRPDGEAVEQVASGRLQGAATAVVNVPAGAIPGASRLLVQVHPGIISQLIEGVEGLLAQPFG